MQIQLISLRMPFLVNKYWYVLDSVNYKMIVLQSDYLVNVIMGLFSLHNIPVSPRGCTEVILEPVIVAFAGMSEVDDVVVYFLGFFSLKSSLL